MASSGDENILEEETVRRTRSGRAVKAPPTAKLPKKTRKKMMLVEVEVSEEEEEHMPIVEAEHISESGEPDDDRDSVSNVLDSSITEQIIDDGSASQQYNDILSSDPLNQSENQTSFVEDSNSLAQSEGHFNAFATESTQDQFESTEREANANHSENNFTNSFPLEESIYETPDDLDESANMDLAENLPTDNLDDSFVESVEQNITEEMKISRSSSKKERDRVVIRTDIVKCDPMDVDGSLVSSQESDHKEDANPDTEVISEDELPTVEAVKVPETEEVSDDELPGPKLAELPADTEVVSEDELPTVKKETIKRKLESTEYDPGSPTSEPEASAAKRPAISPTVEEEKPSIEALDKAMAEKEKATDKTAVASSAKESKSKLPELDKYWKAVNDDPSDFTGWTYLLQYVDQVNDIEAAREAYDAFLSHYPYCYGYWRKYADYEKRKGNKKKCEDVFERGLKAIPLSVDLWLHFLNYTKVAYAENEEHIRDQFERALIACGLEFRSDRLWDTYIKWETEGKRLQNVTSIYDRLLSTPTQGYTTHFDNFQEHVSFHAPNKILGVDEFLTLRKEVRQMLKHDGESTPAADNPDVPPGEDDATEDAIKSDEETKALKERIVSTRRKLHKMTVTAVTARWNFEEGIKRPYFHVKPLERCQLKNWKEYLDYEIEQCDRQRIMVLFERCLIACALYEEFWLRYVRYLEEQKDETLHVKIREVYDRACTVHHVGKPALHLSWAIYEEATSNLTKASEILVNLEKSVPNLLQVAYRRINLERRRGDFEKCAQLYESYITGAKNKLISNNMAIKYARFCLKICKDAEKAIEVLKNAITKDPTNQRLHLQLIDICLQREQIDEKEVLNLIDQFLEKDNDAEQKILFAQRKLEFLEDFGSDIQTVQEAYEDYQKYCKLSKEKKKKDEGKGDSNANKKSKMETQPPLPNAQSGTYSGYGNYGSGTGQTANNYSQYSGQQPGYGGQYGGQYPQSSDQYQYPNWQYSQSGYGGYNQWGSYGNYY